MLIFLVYLFPLFWAVALSDSMETAAHFTWIALLGFGLLWSLAWNWNGNEDGEDPWDSVSDSDGEEETLLCPECGRSNAPDRLLCADCYADLVTLDEEGELVPRVQVPTCKVAS